MLSSRTLTFGGEDPYVATITDPKGPSIGIGAILWGMGLAEMRAARALAKVGIHSLQMRRMTVPRQGGPALLRGREAMELLKAKRGVEKFILLGNCGFAAASFNIAMREPSVVGLILSNPHLSDAVTVKGRYKSKLGNPAAWRRLVAGKVDFNKHLASAGLLRKWLLARATGVSENRLIADFKDRRDFTLPGNLPNKLAELENRGVSTLLFFCHGEASLAYFQDLYQKSLTGLSEARSVTAEILPSTEHRLSQDDRAAEIAAHSIHRWAKRQWGRFGSADRVRGRAMRYHEREVTRV